jgi:tetratricopeptide (TPR) repeat protein
MATFPNSSVDDQVESYAMMALAEMRDNKRLIVYAEKIVAARPDDLPALVMLANTYVDSSETAGKAITYAEKVIKLAMADEPNADNSRKSSAGVAHCVIGLAYANQGKTLPSITELKTAIELLKGHDDQQYARAAYYLGWDYAKLNKLSDARAVLTEAAEISGPIQGPIKELLTKVNAGRARDK